MLVKWTKSIPGGEKRGYVEGREFDWPMQLISKMRADYGHDCLIMIGTLADRNARQKARQEQRVGAKLSRQERLGVLPAKFDEELEPKPKRGRPRKVTSDPAMALADKIADSIDADVDVQVEEDQPVTAG